MNGFKQHPFFAVSGLSPIHTYVNRFKRQPSLAQLAGQETLTRSLHIKGTFSFNIEILTDHLYMLSRKAKRSVSLRVRMRQTSSKCILGAPTHVLLATATATGLRRDATQEDKRAGK